MEQPGSATQEGAEHKHALECTGGGKGELCSPEEDQTPGQDTGHFLECK